MHPFDSSSAAGVAHAGPVHTGTVPASPALGYVHDLDTPLLMFSEQDVWTLRDAAEGVFITGGIGAGKSSSSGAALAKAYLRAGFGGIVCCANVDEVDRWRRYCAEAGRSPSLIVMDKTLAHRFNFLEYQMAVGRGSTFEAVQVLLDILNAAEGKHDTGSGGENQFWDQTLRQILRNTILPVWAAYGRLTLADMMRFMNDRPTTIEQLASDEWMEGSFFFRTMELAEIGGAHPMEPEDYQAIEHYWTRTMMQPDQRTPGNILQTVVARLDPFLTGDLRKLFCTHTTLVPELTFEGAVIVLDLSAHAWGQEGVLAQHIVKIMWQKAMQRRPKTDDARPCFLFADECQYFLAPSDQQFQSTARACRALTVYLTQNLPGIYARIGKQGAQDIADALLGNLATKIFHAQPDSRTAEWAATMIGKAVIWRQNVGENETRNTNTHHSTGRSGGGGSPGGHNTTSGTGDGYARGTNRGASQVVDYRVQPSHFMTLRKGGGPDGTSEAVIFQAGRVFDHTASTWTPTLFKQG